MCFCVGSVLCPEGREGMQESENPYIYFWTSVLCQVSVVFFFLFCQTWMPVKQSVAFLMINFPFGFPFLPNFTSTEKQRSFAWTLPEGGGGWGGHIWMFAGKATITTRKTFIIPASQFVICMFVCVQVKRVKPAHAFAACGYFCLMFCTNQSKNHLWHECIKLNSC